jgi:hypothetical protein
MILLDLIGKKGMQRLFAIALLSTTGMPVHAQIRIGPPRWNITPDSSCRQMLTHAEDVWRSRFVSIHSNPTGWGLGLVDVNAELKATEVFAVGIVAGGRMHIPRLSQSFESSGFGELMTYHGYSGGFSLKFYLTGGDNDKGYTVVQGSNRYRRRAIRIKQRLTVPLKDESGWRFQSRMRNMNVNCLQDSIIRRRLLPKLLMPYAQVVLQAVHKEYGPEWIWDGSYSSYSNSFLQTVKQNGLRVFLYLGKESIIRPGMYSAWHVGLGLNVLYQVKHVTGIFGPSGNVTIPYTQRVWRYVALVKFVWRIGYAFPVKGWRNGAPVRQRFGADPLPANDNPQNGG